MKHISLEALKKQEARDRKILRERGVTIRVSEMEYNILIEKAESQKKPLARYMRDKCLGVSLPGKVGTKNKSKFMKLAVL